MSAIEQPRLRAVNGGKQSFRTVEVVKRAEHDRWDIVEAVQQDIATNPSLAARAADSLPGQRLPVELEQLCSEIADACRGEGADTWKTKTVVDLYRVAQAWPRESRVEGASYGAHERLFTRPDRAVRLQKMVERSSDGRINRNDVDRWLADQKPRKFVGFLEGIERGVRAVLKVKGRPWAKVADEDRAEIARVLRRIANEIENGEFA